MIDMYGSEVGVGNKVLYENSIFKTKNCGNLVVTKYCNNKEVYVKFIETGYETVVELCHIKRGAVKDRLQPSVFGAGIIGEHSVRDSGIPTREYYVWRNMLQRCYSSKLHLSRPTYKDCIVSENFKYFTYFKEWCNEQVGFDNEGWSLDKDILLKGNKIYSEDTCCFVPNEINTLIVNNKALRGGAPVGVHCVKGTGKYLANLAKYGINTYLGTFNTSEEAFYVYKLEKEKYIKEVADKWKDNIDIRVYEALMNYEVSIYD